MNCSHFASWTEMDLTLKTTHRVPRNNETSWGEWKTLYKIFSLCYNEFRMLKSLRPVKAIIVG